MKILSVGIVLGALITLTPAANLEAETKLNHNAEEASKYKINAISTDYYTMILLKLWAKQHTLNSKVAELGEFLHYEKMRIN